MARFASKLDFRNYCRAFMLIYKRILKNDIGYSALGITSTKQGSLVFFTFKRGVTRVRFKRTSRPIGSELQKLPQRAFGGNLSEIVFGGKNVIREGNRLIIIKGDNSAKAWTREKGIRDALEELSAVVGAGE